MGYCWEKRATAATGGLDSGENEPLENSIKALKAPRWAVHKCDGRLADPMGALLFAMDAFKLRWTVRFLRWTACRTDGCIAFCDGRLKSAMGVLLFAMGK